ncbi:MAG: endo-1,4-beta-xylanase [Sporomusaceae bacterium]|nr:endo-1,4-beta-xylanase [Sporomusaceae bacterium]
MKRLKKLLLGFTLCLSFGWILFNSALCTGADLINGHDWRHFTGAKVTDAGIEIMPVGRTIVRKVSVPTETKDADVAEMAKMLLTPNPPINLSGPFLQVVGDFTISMDLNVTNNNGAYVDFYGTLPVIYDEWRQEGKILRVGLEESMLVISIWNGESPDPVIESFETDFVGAGKVTLARVNKNFLFQVNGKSVGHIADPGLFSNGEIVFGADAAMGGGFTIRELTAQANNVTSKVALLDRKSPEIHPVLPYSLRYLGASRDKPLYIGAAVAAIPLASDAQYQSLVGREFSMITPENDMKFQFIHPQANIYAFNEADIIVEFAERNHIRVHGHALVWHEALPVWVTNVNHSPLELKQILSEHIRTIVGRYKGRVGSWDVVNEPLRDEKIRKNHGLRSENPWFKAMGEDYIEFAFREAHAADPEARLYLNEYGIEEPGPKFEVLYAMVQRLLAKGVPIHGIGFQMHEDMESGRYVGSEPDLVAINMNRMVALGLEVRVSEMDVNMNSRSTPRRLNTQSQAFAEMLVMSVKQQGLTSFGQWGVTDRYSSLAQMFEYFKLGNGLIFDADYQPKPAYKEMKHILAGSPDY